MKYFKAKYAVYETCEFKELEPIRLKLDKDTYMSYVREIEEQLIKCEVAHGIVSLADEFDILYKMFEKSVNTPVI